MAAAKMVEIPAGRFKMGSVGFYPEEGPVREVPVGRFAIDRGPVTVTEFARFAEETGYTTVAERTPTATDYPDADPTLAGRRIGGIPSHRPPRTPDRSGAVVGVCPRS